MSAGEAVTANLHAVSLLLNRLQDVGLPLPTYYAVAEIGAFLHFDSLADLTDWALWAEACIDEQQFTTGLHHSTAFKHEGLDVELLYVDRERKAS